MISNQTVQICIDEIKNISKVDLCVYDLLGNTVAATVPEMGMEKNLIQDFISSAADSQVIGEYHLLKVFDEESLTFILVARGESEDAYMIGKIAVSQIKQLMLAYKERYDRNSFFQNLLMDNLLLVDIYNRAKKLRVEINVPRVVFLIEALNEKDGLVEELLKNTFSNQNGDYITSVDESNIILVKQLKESEDYEDLISMAETLVSTINTEALVSVRVSFGTIVKELKDVSKSYKEAQMALDVGEIFYAQKTVIGYNTLGIGRLIYQLPENLCRIFLKEIFGEDGIRGLNDDIINMANRFFENNLNISETSSQIFVHRNTLVYRIEKLQKATGLDIRNFDDALTFKIALMVANYMKYLDSRE